LSCSSFRTAIFPLPPPAFFLILLVTLHFPQDLYQVPSGWLGFLALRRGPPSSIIESLLSSISVPERFCLFLPVCAFVLTLSFPRRSLFFSLTSPSPVAPWAAFTDLFLHFLFLSWGELASVFLSWSLQRPNPSPPLSTPGTG